MPSLVNEWFYLSSARFLLVKTVQYSSQRRGTPNLHLLSHPLTLRRCNLSNESNCIVCRDAPLEFLNLPWCPSTVTGIAVVPSLTQTFPRQELQCPMTNEIRPLLTVCRKQKKNFLGQQVIRAQDFLGQQVITFYMRTF